MCGQHAAALRASAPTSLFTWNESQQVVPGPAEAVAPSGDETVEYAWELPGGRLSIGSGTDGGVAILAFRSPTAVVRARLDSSRMADLAKCIRTVGRASRESKRGDVELTGPNREWAVRLHAETTRIECHVRDSETSLSFTLEGTRAPEIASKFEQVARVARRRR